MFTRQSCQISKAIFGIIQRDVPLSLKYSRYQAISFSGFSTKLDEEKLSWKAA